MSSGYDALLVLSFGGPEGMEEVMPFLRNVVRGRNVPEERLREVAEHYSLFSGVSPLNQENRRLIEDLRRELKASGIDLPLYWGNRNWRPFLADVLARMKADGASRVLAFVTSAYGSYSSCRQYLEDIAHARAAIEDPPVVDKIPPFFDHPGFLEANRLCLEAALGGLGEESRARAAILFTAHSLPLAMASSCRYEQELEEVRARVSAGLPNPTRLVYQSRSGPPSQPWLEPDLLDVLRELARGGARQVVLAPVGFVSDHMEVVYDLDVEARRVADELGLELVRARTAGSHSRFVRMVRELVEERLREGPPGACPPGCCVGEPA